MQEYTCFAICKNVHVLLYARVYMFCYMQECTCFAICKSMHVLLNARVYMFCCLMFDHTRRVIHFIVLKSSCNFFSFFQHTDICEHALECLLKSSIRKVIIVGRRGPLEVQHVFKSLKQLCLWLHLVGCVCNQGCNCIAYVSTTLTQI